MKSTVAGSARRTTATIRDVALRAGVAVGTVSRVVNKHPDVNEELRDRVLRAAEELQYRPNARAQSLARKSSALLSFILGNRSFLHPFHSHVLQGVQEYCEEAGYFVTYSSFLYEQDVKPADLRLPYVVQVNSLTDCLILAGTNHDNFLKALEQRDIPYVLLGNNFVGSRAHPPVNQVSFDDAAGAAEAVRYLIQLGHRHIWFLGDISLPWFRKRYLAYKREMEKAKLKPIVQTVALSDDRFVNGLKSTQMLLDHKRPVTAIFAGTDDLAFGAWEGLRRHGLQVPRDVSIIGFDDQLPNLRMPSLTTVRVDTAEIGRQLGRMAIARSHSKGAPIPEIVLPTKLMKRGTCRPLLDSFPVRRKA